MLRRASSRLLHYPFNGRAPNMRAAAHVCPSAVLAGDVQLAAGSSVWPNCTLRGDAAAIIVGERSNVQDHTMIHTASSELSGTPQPTTIGRDVTVGHMCLLHACTIEDECLVGMGSTVMDGAVMERGSMLAAGSLLPGGKRVPSGELWGGRPAKPLRTLKEEEKKFLELSAQHYYKLAQQHAEQISKL